MSEDSSLDERFSKEIPAQFLLGEATRRRVEVLGARIAQYVKDKTDRDISPRFASFSDNIPRTPVAIGEIDEVRLGAILYDPEAGVAVVALDTFADKSPFAYDEDLGIPDILPNAYDIVSLPEHPPFIAHTLRIDGGNPTAVRKYLREVQEGKQPQPHILDNQQAAQVIAMIQNPEIEGYLDYEEGLYVCWPR